MASTKVPPGHDARQVAALLRLPEIVQFIADLDETRWTGRPGYPIRTMVGAALVKAIYALPTWTRTARLIAEHTALREAIGGTPSHWACYRFATKLRDHGDMLTACIDRVLATLHTAYPQMGQTIAIDGSDLPAYANGQRYVSRGGKVRERYSDPDASWGHRSSISTRSGGGYYGYKVHAAVCTTTGLPLAWQVETAKDSEIPMVPVLVDIMHAREFTPAVLVMDRGYDAEAVYETAEGYGIRSVIPLRMTPASRPGSTTHPHVTMAPGRSPGPTRNAARPSGAAPRTSAFPHRSG
ncbi:MAG TPA: transposase [Streptosporangiaceae bacterium]|nr:transposase [Streptosporangiaceae bacterium]